MLISNGNPYCEAHDSGTRVYEFIADGTKDSHLITRAIEETTGLHLGSDHADRHGYINTSLRPDGSRFVAIMLYNENCGGAGCGAGHPFPFVRTDDLTIAQQDAIKAAVGESNRHRLNNNEAANRASLRILGFKDHDGPLSGTNA